jgi:hypothetical protein
VFEQFLSWCEPAGQANCKLAGGGDLAARVRALLARLRKGPIPALPGPAPYELQYGDLLLDMVDARVRHYRGPSSQTSSTRRTHDELSVRAQR